VEDPFMIVLTDGPENVAYFEHAQAAERLRIPLVIPADLIAEGDRLAVALPGGCARAVDVVYRRTDEDRVRDDAGALTEVARLLLPAWLGGHLGLVNAFGNGIADDKLIHGHVEDFIRFYLDEEPMVRSVPTAELRSARDVRKAIASLRELVIKPRHGHGGKGVVIGAHAEPTELEQLADELEAHPEQYISQPTVALSLHPSVIDGRLERRHVDLRVFAFCTDEVGIVPGGLSRVALEEHALVVNSSQHGGGKDTWVID
jgi:carboxylate-amine ligase